MSDHGGNEARAEAFDALSRSIARAYATGDERRARRLGDEAVAGFLLPRVRQLAGLKVFRRDLVEEVTAHALLRVAADWRRGKPVSWAVLQRVVVNSAVDLARREERVATVDVGTDDEAQLEAFLASEGAGPRGRTLEDEALDRVRIDELLHELEHLRRPRWAAYVRAWRDGYRSAPDVEHVTGIRQGRVRQIRMDLCQFLTAYQPDLVSWFGCVSVRSEASVRSPHHVQSPEER